LGIVGTSRVVGGLEIAYPGRLSYYRACDPKSTSTQGVEMNLFTRGRRRAGLLVTLAALAVVALGVTVANAARGNWVHNVAPKNHKSYLVGDRIHFKVRAMGVSKGYKVFAAVSTSRATKHGVLKDKHPEDFFAFKKRRHHRYVYTPPNHTFSQWYMQKPGKYYWQAQFADASCAHVTCHSKIRSFRVHR
jgi:hypothetical protein